MSQLHRDLILPAHASLRVIESASDQGSVRAAREMVAGSLSVIATAAKYAGRELSAAYAGAAAMDSADERYARTGIYRMTGPELVALRAAITEIDAVLPTLRTDHVTRAVIEIYEEMERREKNGKI